MSYEILQPNERRNADLLEIALKDAEWVRKDGHFIMALEIAEAELAPFINAFEDLTFQQLALVAKLARMDVSSATSAASRSPLPENRVRLINRAFDGALESFYKNPTFISKLRVAIQNKEMKGDEPQLITELWRDLAKVPISAFPLYKGEQYEELVALSNWLWLELYESLSEIDHQKPFIGIEYQLFLDGINQKVDIGQLILDLQALEFLLIDSNAHRLGTMAIRLVRLGKKIKNNQLKDAAQAVFDRLRNRDPETAKKLDNPLKTAAAKIKDAINLGVIPLNGKTESKDQLHTRLTGLETAPFLPPRETGLQ